MIDLQPTNNHLPELLRRLEDGWRIEEPLLQRSVMYGWDGRRLVFEVVLYKQGERQILALSDEPEIEQFLDQRRLSILAV